MLKGSPCLVASPDETPTPEENAKRTAFLVFGKMNVRCLDDILTRGRYQWCQECHLPDMCWLRSRN